ncbi:putative membrane protein YczE [Bacillus mesophilus]|uniref:Membrane protein n=1 Tax=Bacillus mesophilus TaxID=1808955 RepID=A0A6M0Q3L3_9BACI|nr:membrane protein [Bacillus mesophilus]MBM7659894.1 putative membrane protein YczE [Bacillus mesophilus]NEY70753.1 membrane protein [Bacillus mesophilus]
MHAIRIAFYLTGLLILSFGVTLTIKSDLGAGPWDALNVGLSTTIGLTVGSWVIIVGLILIVINALLLQEKPDVFAIFTILIVGGLIDFWLLYVLNQFDPTGLLFKIIVLMLGLIFLSLGIAIYLQAKYPLIPIDRFMLAIQHRLKVNLMVAKTIAEITALILALLFKGPIGIGTIIIALSVGPLVQLFFPPLERLRKKWS